MMPRPMLLWSLVLVAILRALGAVEARAQDPSARGNWNQSHDPYVAAIGLAGGMSSGTGLSVRWPALPQTMVSLTGGVWGESDDLAWNVGVEAHLVLRQVGRMRILAGPALALYSDDSDDEANTNASIGIGLEYLFRPRISAKLDVGFTYLSDSGNVYPLPQAGVFFYF